MKAFLHVYDTIPTLHILDITAIKSIHNSSFTVTYEQNTLIFLCVFIISLIRAKLTKHYQTCGQTVDHIRSRHKLDIWSV